MLSNKVQEIKDKQKFAHKLFIYSYLVNIVLISCSQYILPSRIATHFNVRGEPDAFGPASTSLLLLGVQSLIFLIFLLVPKISFRFPDKWINLPEKSFWMTPEHKPLAQALMESYMWQMGTATMLLFLVLEFEMIHANMRVPIHLNPKVMTGAIGVFVVYACYFSFTFPLAFRKYKAS